MSCPPLKRLETKVWNLQKREIDLETLETCVEKGQERLQSLVRKVLEDDSVEKLQKRLETRVENLQRRIDDLERVEGDRHGKLLVGESGEGRLKPCPFGCTCTSPQVESTGLVKVPYAVRCSWCGSKGPSEGTEDQSVKSWNKRSC